MEETLVWQSRDWCSNSRQAKKFSYDMGQITYPLSASVSSPFNQRFKWGWFLKSHPGDNPALPVVATMVLHFPNGPLRTEAAARNVGCIGFWVESLLEQSSGEGRCLALEAIHIQRLWYGDTKGSEFLFTIGDNSERPSQLQAPSGINWCVRCSCIVPVFELGFLTHKRCCSKSDCSLHVNCLRVFFWENSGYKIN